MNDPIEQTHTTYDHIAPIYAQARQQRQRFAEHMARFATLLPALGPVLDVGCGPGFDTAVLRTTFHLSTIGLDLSHAMMRTGRDTYANLVPFAQTDMRQLPVGNGRIVGIWASASLLHIPHNQIAATLAELNRVLQPGGILFLSLKLGDGHYVEEAAYGQPHPRYFALWQPAALDAALQTAHFTITDGWIDETPQQQWIVRYAQSR
jgi:ubiquinone/menaquinone biosynthesis C-methylase UbiE